MDLALLIGSGGLDEKRILHALCLTFNRRATQKLPDDAATAANRLAQAVANAGEECGLADDLDAVFEGVRDFLKETMASRQQW